MTTATKIELQRSFVDAARDTKINLQNVLNQTSLSPEQALGTALACAYNEQDEELIQQLVVQLEDQPGMVQDAQTAATLMAMNNVFYRFRHMVEKDVYQTLPARLRMQKLAQPQSSALNLEMFSLAVSAINGCEICIQSHEASLLKHGASEQNVLDTIRIAAVMRAASVARAL